MSWNIKIPFRSPYDPLDPGTIYELTADLDSEDRAVTRELFTQLKMEGATTVAHAIHGMKSLDAPKRRRLLNWLRHACGLKSTDDVEAEERFERANAAARAVVASAFQSCPACGSIPTDEIGAWRPVNVKRWWCEAHRDQAQPGDMDVRSSGIRISESGALVPCDEGELAKQQAKAEIRRAELEASMAQRREEAESRRQYEEALRADLAKHLPPGFSR